MLLVKQINLPLDTDFDDLIPYVSGALKLKPQDIISLQLYRKSIDARHKNNIVFCCSFLIEAKNENIVLKRCKNAEIYVEKPYVWHTAQSAARPVVVGFGPAGMFAALALARAGLKPIVLERGQDVDTRLRQVQEFFDGAPLNTESNVQFGEGGAGTFSDGKLNTGIKDIRCREVLKVFNAFGAQDKILYEAKPHIGTDILVGVVKNIRNEIIKLGGEVKFGCRMDKIITDGGSLQGVTVTEGDNVHTISCKHLILALGHSARDTFFMLKNIGVKMARKQFSVGARIEHHQKDINKALYGDFANDKYLPAADYKLAVHLPSGRGVYTFCMCPGGEVINASSEAEAVAVNGMSYSARDGENANSAVLVDVRPDDLEGEDVLAGIFFQREIEQRAYQICGGKVPICTVGDLLEKPEEKECVNPTVKPDTVKTGIYNVLPAFVADSIKQALPLLGKKLSGFDNASAMLTFPETRSSSPVRILRGEDYMSLNLIGLYPAGEGAGYAGGIMSAAVDGMRVAEQVIASLNGENI